MCLRPFRRGVAEYGCGQCLPCRINRRRMWCTRLMLEATQHQASFFVTLTYAPEHLPEGGTLVPRDLQLYLKRLRKCIYPRKVRYYGVGEYGDKSGRPHYHLILFGVLTVEEMTESWGKGLVHVGDVTPDSVSYVVSYTVKQMTKADDARLGGRHPEFALMSKGGRDGAGGIGLGAVKTIAGALTTKAGARYVGLHGDIPGVVRMDMQFMPLGKYLRSKIKEATGFVRQKYVRGAEPLRLDMLKRQLELRSPGAREAREVKREYTGRRARVLEAIKRSKKGIGI